MKSDLLRVWWDMILKSQCSPKFDLDTKNSKLLSRAPIVEINFRKYKRASKIWLVGIQQFVALLSFMYILYIYTYMYDINIFIRIYIYDMYIYIYVYICMYIYPTICSPLFTDFRTYSNWSKDSNETAYIYIIHIRIYIYIYTYMKGGLQIVGSRQAKF